MQGDRLAVAADDIPREGSQGHKMPAIQRGGCIRRGRGLPLPGRECTELQAVLFTDGAIATLTARSACLAGQLPGLPSAQIQHQLQLKRGLQRLTGSGNPYIARLAEINIALARFDQGRTHGRPPALDDRDRALYVAYYSTGRALEKRGVSDWHAYQNHLALAFLLVKRPGL
jgi:hypothetical protein